MAQEFEPCLNAELCKALHNAAWLHPKDAIKQRERLKAERIAAREQRVEPVRDVQPINENLPEEALEPQENEREAAFEEYEENVV